MSGSGNILEDQSALSKADRWYFRLESWLNLAGGLVIFALVLLATTNILGRWFFDLPISGYIDWVEQAMAFLAFLGIAYTQRMGGHIRMDILIGQMHGRPLWLAEFVSALLMLGLTLVLIYGSYLHFLRAFELGDSSLDINLPTWPAKLVVPVALTVLALRLVLHLWGYLRAIREGGDEPVAVPLIENAAEVAAAEAKALAEAGPGEDTK
jgi:TRAP-type C4-dicarboxylate transport system permease small subunit